MSEPSVHRRKIILAWIAIFFIVLCLVSGVKITAAAHAGQHKGQIIPGLHKTVGRGIDRGRFIQCFVDFGKKPLAGDRAAARQKKFFTPGARHLVHSVGIGGGGMMLPQFGIGVRLPLKFRKHGKRRAVFVKRQDRTTGKIHAHTGHL